MGAAVPPLAAERAIPAHCVLCGGDPHVVALQLSQDRGATTWGPYTPVHDGQPLPLRKRSPRSHKGHEETRRSSHRAAKRLHPSSCSLCPLWLRGESSSRRSAPSQSMLKMRCAQPTQPLVAANGCAVVDLRWAWAPSFRIRATSTPPSSRVHLRPSAAQSPSPLGMGSFVHFGANGPPPQSRHVPERQMNRGLRVGSVGPGHTRPTWPEHCLPRMH